MATAVNDFENERFGILDNVAKFFLHMQRLQEDAPRIKRTAFQLIFSRATAV